MRQQTTLIKAQHSNIMIFNNSFIKAMAPLANLLLTTILTKSQRCQIHLTPLKYNINISQPVQN